MSGCTITLNDNTLVSQINHQSNPPSLLRRTQLRAAKKKYQSLIKYVMYREKWMNMGYQHDRDQVIKSSGSIYILAKAMSLLLPVQNCTWELKFKIRGSRSAETDKLIIPRHMIASQMYTAAMLALGKTRGDEKTKCSLGF